MIVFGCILHRLKIFATRIGNFLLPQSPAPRVFSPKRAVRRSFDELETVVGPFPPPPSWVLGENCRLDGAENAQRRNEDLSGPGVMQVRKLLLNAMRRETERFGHSKNFILSLYLLPSTDSTAITSTLYSALFHLHMSAPQVSEQTRSCFESQTQSVSCCV